MRRGSFSSASPYPKAPTGTLGMSQSMLSMSVAASAGSKRPRTITAQAEALVLHHHNHTPAPGKDQVVVGIAAAAGDDVEDWSGDFVERSPRGSGHDESGAVLSSTSARNSERFSGTGSSGDGSDGGLPRLVRGFPRSTSLFHRPSFGRRSWQRQHSFDSGIYGDGDRSRRSSRIRKSSNDVGETPRSSSFSDSRDSSYLQQAGDATSETGSVEAKLPPALTARVVPELDDEDDDEPFERRISVGESLDGDDDDEDEGEAGVDDDDDDEDEDWDAEFGFTDPPDDDELKPGGAGFVDPNRRRSDNFNIFLRGFHDMMAGEDLMDDDDDFGRSKKSRNSSEEPLFQRRRSDMGPSVPSVDGSVDAIRSSLTSLPGTTEYSLLDKYRLLDVACSSSYAVRIEKFPKPCTTFSNLERNAVTAAEFPMFTDNRLEQWLMNVTGSKCDEVNEMMAVEHANTPNPRQQKNHQFRTLVSIPFGKRFVDKCFKQISVYRFYGEEKSNRELIRVFFEKLATAGIADEYWSSNLSSDDLVHVAGVVMEVLQEAARMYGPVPANGSVSCSHSVSGSSSTSHYSSATAFWMRQFQTILTICLDAFPTYRNVIAMIELRFVCHHLVGLANGDLTYSWQICNQYPEANVTLPAQPIAGQSAPIIANEILQYYGALIDALQADIQAASEARSTRRRSSGAHSSLPQLVPRYCTSTDPISLLAMVVCDIQTVYSSRSALSETMIPELGELFEFDDDDSPPSYYEFGRGFSRISSDDRGFEEDEQSRVSVLIKPSSSARRRILEEDLYVAIDVAKDPLVKARCAAVLSSMHSSAATNAVSNSSPRSHLKIAESLAYESLRILEWVTSRRLRELKATNDKLVGDSQRKEHLSSLFSNDGLVSEMGREILENLGNLLVTNHKYRYGILCLEAATDIFSLLNQGRDHDRIDRLMCTLTLQADDIKRALPLHEKVAASCLRQGNTNEYVFLTQTLTGMWLREGHFSRAEEYLSSAFTFLRDQTSLLPPFFLSALNGASPGSEAQSTSSRSGTVLTASSSASSNGGGGGSFVFSGSRGHTSEMDLWLNHDITLHLLLRDLYRASGRFVEGMRVLEYLLNYSGRLPRGKRTQLRMLLAEDSLQLRVLDTTRYMFHLLDQEANFFCDRILQSTLGGMVSGGNSSGGFGSNSGGAGSSSGGRSLGGMGSEARFCFDMVLSVRYIIGRAKLYLQLGELRYAYAWLSLAHIKNERESFRTHAKLHVLDGRVLMELLRRQHEHRVFPEKTQSASYISSLKMSVQASVDEMLQSFTSSLYVLTKSERQLLRDRLINYCDAAETPDKCMDMAVQAYWSAYDLYQTLDDGHHQLKSLLGVIQCQLTPIERSFFALGSSTNDELLVHLLGSCAAVPRKSAFAAPQNGEKSSSTEGTVRTENDTEDDTPIEKVRKTLQDCQQLLRQALNLSEQLAEPNSYFRTLVFCSQTWTWLERLAPYKSERPIKEAAAFWDEAVKVMKAVFFRRVAFECTPRNRQTIQRAAKSGGLQGATMSPDSSTFCLVPILNFRESIILRLEGLTLQLITTACQLQQFERVPEYVEDVLLLHIDELLSARMCLNSVAHQLRSFRSQQQHQSVVRHIPLHSIPGPTSVPGVPAAKGSGSEHPPVSRSSFSSNSLPGVLPSTPLIGASGTKRKGHKKNQSMSSISELLASSSSGPHGTSSSFHDLSLSFVSTGGRGTVLSGGATPRTGLASLSDRLSTISITSNRPEASPVASGVRSPTSRDSESELSRLRMRSRSAPQPISPVSVRQQIPTEILSPVNESNGPGGVDMYSGHHVIDLKDVRLWSTSAFGEGLRETFAHTNATSSSTGAIGIYDFDDVQSERLWWIFNAWRASKENYITGKIEVSSFRHQNLKTLRMLLDAFDPQQVAVLYIGDKSSNSMPGFDVAHINSHTFLEDRGFVLCMGYDDQQLRATSLSHQLHRHQHHSRLEFKIFKSIPDKPITWRQEIPRADWYLSQHHFFDGSATSSGEAVLRTMRLLGAKLILKLVGALLLENSLVVIGSSFPLVKEVTLCLVRLLRPFRWHHTFLSFLPIPSWRFLADTLQHHVHAQLAGRPRTKMSLGLSASEWRWGSPRAATAPSSTRSAASTSSSGSRTVPGEIASEEHEPPFIIGTMSDTWQTCLQRLRTSSTDERLIPAFVNVLDLDDLDSFATAKSSLNAVPFPRKFRKQFMERFDKVVKQRRKVQEKSINVSLRQRPPSAAQVRSGSHSIRSAHSRRSQERHSSRRPSLSKVSSAAMAFDDDRLTYDNECATAFMSGLHDFYDRLSSLSVERAKKMQGKKKHSKRQEIKSWFSSTHEFDAFVDRFLDTSIYQRYELEKNASPSIPETSTVSHGTLSRSSSGVTTNTGPRSGRNPLSMTSANSMAAHSMFANASLVRSFGSRSSTSSSFNGPPSTSHLQL